MVAPCAQVIGLRPYFRPSNASATWPVCPSGWCRGSSNKRGLCPARGLPGFGRSSQSVQTTSSEWLVPHELLPCAPPAQAPPAPAETAQDATSPKPQATVYTVRFRTSWDRGSAIDEPFSGVHLCLIGADGAAVLRRISPVHDPADNTRVLEEICSVRKRVLRLNFDMKNYRVLVGQEAGADCSALDSAKQPSPLASGREPKLKQRFQEGSVDEVSFLAPELGPLTAILLAPECGSWVCDEVDVYSSRSQHTDRFVCRRRLGGRRGEAAAYLTPIPPDAIVYGMGDAARIITKEQASQLQASGMAEYGQLKGRLLVTTALLTLAGSGVAALASGADAAVPFALGGAAGLLYQMLLQLGADAAVAGAATAAVRSGDELKQGPRRRALEALGSPAVRLGLLAGSAVVAALLLHGAAGPTMAPVENGLLALQLSAADAWQLGLGLCGFMMNKVAIVGVGLTPPPRRPSPSQGGGGQEVAAAERGGP